MPLLFAIMLRKMRSGYSAVSQSCLYMVVQGNDMLWAWGVSVYLIAFSFGWLAVVLFCFSFPFSFFKML